MRGLMSVMLMVVVAMAGDACGAGCLVGLSGGCGSVQRRNVFQWRPLIVGRLERDVDGQQCVMGPCRHCAPLPAAPCQGIAFCARMGGQRRARKLARRKHDAVPARARHRDTEHGANTCAAYPCARGEKCASETCASRPMPAVPLVC
eukprot:SAG31_NODE_13450_length_868_cov_1.925878_1_plen_147_part_10